MKRKNKSILLLISGMFMLNSSMLHAAQPKFSVVPVSGAVTIWLLPTNFTETVSYVVTNQTSITRTLTMVPIQGVTQTTTGSGVCSNPFTLASQQSCTLTLVINGSQVSTSGINGGPVICKTKSSSDSSPDPFLCSEPSIQNALGVSVTTAGQHAYVANQTDNSISVCQVNPATGILTNCNKQVVTGLVAPEGVGFNPAGTFFYIANINGNSVTVCQANTTTGTLSNCVNSGTGFNLPDAVAFSPNGNIFYTSNGGGGGSVSACLVNSSTGLLSSCVNNTDATFSLPSDMTVNSAGTLAYVTNRTASTTSVCNVSGQTVNSCNNLSGSLFNQPEGVTLHPLGTKAYITNAGNNEVILCNVLSSSGLLDSCVVTGGAFRGTGNIGINSRGEVAYVPNQDLNKVYKCRIDAAAGYTLTDCSDSLGTGFGGPSGVVLK